MRELEAAAITVFLPALGGVLHSALATTAPRWIRIRAAAAFVGLGGVGLLALRGLSPATVSGLPYTVPAMGGLPVTYFDLFTALLLATLIVALLARGAVRSVATVIMAVLLGMVCGGAMLALCLFGLFFIHFAMTGDLLYEGTARLIGVMNLIGSLALTTMVFRMAANPAQVAGTLHQTMPVAAGGHPGGSLKFCPQCGDANYPGAIYCVKCGEQMPA